MALNKKSDEKKVSDYFTLSAELFDSLYSEDKVGPFMRFLNKHFRSDIYERFRLTMENVRQNSYQSVLDVGCGSSRYVEALHNMGVKRIVGLDISEGMLELSRQRMQGKPHVDFVLSDFMQYKTAEKFDCVLAMGFFDYVADPARVLAKMGRMAEKAVILSFPSVSFYRTPIRKIRYRIKNCPVYFYTEPQIRGLCESLNFSACEITKLPGAGMDYWVLIRK